MCYNDYDYVVFGVSYVAKFMLLTACRSSYYVVPQIRQTGHSHKTPYHTTRTTLKLLSTRDITYDMVLRT